MFHASKHLFNAPDYELMEANRENHANGGLGLWVSYSSEWIKGFGSHIYAVEVSGPIRDLPISELKKWAREGGNNADFYRAKRAELVGSGVAFLRVLEQDGRSEMGVVVDFNAIRRFTPVSQHTKHLLAEAPRGIGSVDASIPAEEKPHQRSPVFHYAVQECVKEVEPGVVKTIGYQVIHNGPGGTAAAATRPLFACKRAGLETLMSAVADANHRVAHTMIDGSEARDLLTRMPVIKSLQDAGLALPLAAVEVSDIQVKTIPIPDVQRLSKEADAPLEVEFTDAPGTI